MICSPLARRVVRTLATASAKLREPDARAAEPTATDASAPPIQVIPRIC
jgi:hypothetical protein